SILANCPSLHVALCALGTDGLDVSSPGWLAAVARTPSCLAVDILAPSRISAAAHVSACVVDGVLRITVHHQNLGEVEDDSFLVQLPAGAAEGQPVGTKMSHKLGLICTQVALSSAMA
ncbi:hypothetical protein T492DRAFT_863918, partial [Pavlovales sp. CCMP2436]